MEAQAIRANVTRQTPATSNLDVDMATFGSSYWHLSSQKQATPAKSDAIKVNGRRNAVSCSLPS